MPCYDLLQLLQSQLPQRPVLYLWIMTPADMFNEKTVFLKIQKSKLIVQV